MAPHSGVLAWRIPGMVEPGGLPSMGSHRVGHDRSDLAAAAAAHLYCIFYLGSIEESLFISGFLGNGLKTFGGCSLVSHLLPCWKR